MVRLPINSTTSGDYRTPVSLAERLQAAGASRYLNVSRLVETSDRGLCHSETRLGEIDALVGGNPISEPQAIVFRAFGSRPALSAVMSNGLAGDRPNGRAYDDLPSQA
jgi:hypothetical protein